LENQHGPKNLRPSGRSTENGSNREPKRRRRDSGRKEK